MVDESNGIASSLVGPDGRGGHNDLPSFTTNEAVPLSFPTSSLWAARIWRSGELPGWNPFSFSGSPLLALNQPGVFWRVAGGNHTPRLSQNRT